MGAPRPQAGAERVSRIEVPGSDDFLVLNTHTSAFAEDDTKKEQLNLFRGHLGDVDASGAQFVAGGDLNSVPKGTQQVNNYADDCIDGRLHF